MKFDTKFIHDEIGDDREDTRLLREMSTDAQRYMESQKWCKKVNNVLFGDGVGKIIASFLIEIEPTRKGIDKELWVIVGDIPNAYLVTEQTKNGLDAIKVYIDLMQDWINCVNIRGDTNKCFPINVSPTKKWAKELQSRIDFIKNEIVVPFTNNPVKPANRGGRRNSDGRPSPRSH